MARIKPFNNPFGTLKLQPKPAPQEAPARAKKPAPRAVTVPAPLHEEDEAALFRALIGEVVPVRGGPQIIEPPPPPPEERRRILDEDEEVLDSLSELVAGAGPFDVADSDEFIEGAVEGLDKRILRRLRKGDYSVQAYLDLHGLIRSEAKEALFAFIEKSRFQGLRCVLIVHGRGLHSRDQLPVLKEGVQGWLSRGRLAQRVLAFTTARPHDGGAGAVYVLLRR